MILLDVAKRVGWAELGNSQIGDFISSGSNGLGWPMGAMILCLFFILFAEKEHLTIT